MKSPLIIALFAACAAAAQVDFRVETVKAEASAESPARVDLVLDIAPKWHIYGKTASVGEPTKFEFSLPDGIKSVSLEWQKEKTFESFGEKYGGYDGKATVSALIYPKAGAKTGTEKIKVSAKWLACSDTCVPQEKSAEFEMRQKAPVLRRTRKFQKTPPPRHRPKMSAKTRARAKRSTGRGRDFLRFFAPRSRAGLYSTSCPACSP